MDIQCQAWYYLIYVNLIALPAYEVRWLLRDFEKYLWCHVIVLKYSLIKSIIIYCIWLPSLFDWIVFNLSCRNAIINYNVLHQLWRLVVELLKHHVKWWYWSKNVTGQNCPDPDSDLLFSRHAMDSYNSSIYWYISVGKYENMTT